DLRVVDRLAPPDVLEDPPGNEREQHERRDAREREFADRTDDRSVRDTSRVRRISRAPKQRRKPSVPDHKRFPVGTLPSAVTTESMGLPVRGAYPSGKDVRASSIDRGGSPA